MPKAPGISTHQTSARHINHNQVAASQFANKAWPTPSAVRNIHAGLDAIPSQYETKPIAERIAQRLTRHGADFEAHLPQNERIEWAAFTQGAPEDLARKVAQDPGVLPAGFDTKRHVPLYGGVVTPTELPTLIERLKTVKLGHHSGHRGQDGLTQLAQNIHLEKKGPQENAQGYQPLGTHGNDSLWLLQVRGDHRLSELVGSEAPSVRYGIAITGQAFQTLFTQQLSIKAPGLTSPSLPNAGID
ncbi:MAG TPA: hypothetical protein PLQ67_09695 [Burkholderiaceae bacterium]|mgnify:CR=1 FL=1|nr:hypothetical protein [Burkholderiaceae bacterium]